ncbi:MAG: HEAT repeat domain-containing protein [Acidobacteriota bacterium]|nr:HEAT repeat domain-containing protein [Acidobacteriota bacterium]
MRRYRATFLLLSISIATAATLAAQSRARPSLEAADIDAIATLLELEDARTYDASALGRILESAHPEVRRRAVQSVGRIGDKKGATLLEIARKDKDVEVAATAAWAAGQLRDPAAVPWLSESLNGSGTPPTIQREAAIALGKIQAPESRTALARYLSETPVARAPTSVVGEALLAIGRFPPQDDIAAIVRWAASQDVELRWRTAWALFRPRHPAALPHLLRLADDSSPDVRFRAVRGLAPYPNLDPAPSAARLRAAVRDRDRRVRTEALRALSQHDDDASFALVMSMLTSPDAWLSVSAAEGLARYTTRADVIVPQLVAAAGADRPLALRLTARQALPRLGPAGKAALDVVTTEGLPSLAPAVRGARPVPQLRSDAEYRQVVERWIVSNYNGARPPRAELVTARGTIELEFHPGDAPLGLEYFIRVTESGEIVGTEFSRVVPNFVAQQRGIRNDVVLRDEVSRRGLTRGNLSWASAGLDTGRPGYTLGVTPQPHNEGNFTALGRVVRGMDVLERLQLGDTITGARMLKYAGGDR